VPAKSATFPAGQAQTADKTTHGENPLAHVILALHRGKVQEDNPVGSSTAAGRRALPCTRPAQTKLTGC
jgi:hypothetical protein